MEQEELESKAVELFSEQGLKVEDRGSDYFVEQPGLSFKVFSSEKYDEGDVNEASSEVQKVFIDEGFEGVDDIDNVSVIRDSETDSPETPSYELIGDIAVISELPDMSRDTAVESIMEHHPHVETVLLKEGGLKGEFRVGDYENLEGDDTETVHREFGSEFLVDPTEVYYSERFSTERDRVVSQIKDGERVLVMFAGVGPFAVLAASNSSPSEVIGIEKNPEAAEYFLRNVELNDLDDKIEVIEGDVSEKMEGLGSFDRIVMPLPGSADEFLNLALKHSKDGGIIHYYRFVEDGDWSTVLEEVEEAAERQDVEAEVKEKVVCGHRGPSIDRVCLDIQVN